MHVDKKKLAKQKFKHSDYPSYIQQKINHPDYRKPQTREEMREFWKGIEKLIKQYAYRLSKQYYIDQEELIQQSYIFVTELLSKYQPAFPCDVVFSNQCNSTCKFWADCHKQEFFGWQTYKLKPYLFSNIYQQMRYYSQKHFRHQKKLFDLDFSQEGSDYSDTSEAVLTSISDKRNMTGYVERKLLSETLVDVLDEVLESCKPTKKEVGVLFFKESVSEKKIHELLGKSQSTVNTHISAIKQQVIKHPKIVEFLDSLEEDDISISDLLND